ncbi:MAG: hypothetical protein LBN34_01305 [Clostridiales Family XIII bacterium]|jgi:hypothetical protein|nr:hypothetical protein [Clostridiales Family XIII bacterium]
MNLIIVVALLGLFFWGNEGLYVLAYIALWLIISARTLIGKSRKRVKLMMIGGYSIIMVLQIVCCVITIFSTTDLTLFGAYARKALGIAMFFLPLVVNHYISTGKHASFYLPPVTEVATVSFADAKYGAKVITNTFSAIHSTRTKITKERISEVIGDIPRHSSLHYVNDGNLTDEYFEIAEKSLDDPYIYIAISRTGGAASELISAFTLKQYNHASLSFDEDLETIISYNGGERLYPPGLNFEMLEYFNQIEESSIMVYKLPATRAQKQTIMERVREINEQGSAYNMMGLVLKYSHKPNIMFCSQFVYNMLDEAGLTYFEKHDASVKPTDLIELDYYKKLDFAYEIRFNE